MNWIKKTSQKLQQWRQRLQKQKPVQRREQKVVPKVKTPVVSTAKKTATASKNWKQQATKEGHKLLNKGLKVDPTFAGNQKPVKGNNKTYRAKEIQRDIKPPWTPNVKGKKRTKSKGRSL